jgi:hypothetical protein
LRCNARRHARKLRAWPRRLSCQTISRV